MAVTATEWTAVGGRINAAAFWPGLSGTQRTAMFTAWITRAGSESAIAALTDADQQDGATRLQVDLYARRDVFETMVANPAQVAVEGKGSSGYTQGQIDAAERAMNDAQSALDDFLALAEDSEAETFGVIRSFRD